MIAYPATAQILVMNLVTQMCVCVCRMEHHLFFLLLIADDVGHAGAVAYSHTITTLP